MRTDFQPPPGGVLKVEVSAKQPDVSGAEAAGIWPALWMLGAPARGVGATNWPSIGEADILETAGGHDSNWGTFHCGTWGGVCNEPDGKSSGERTAASLGLSSFKTSFHTYAIEWDQSTSPQEMRWYIDGVNYHTVRATDMPADVWTAATNHGYFLVMDIAMGGGLADKAGGGPTAATKSGVPLLVDYFSVSSKAGSGGNAHPDQQHRPAARDGDTDGDADERDLRPHHPGLHPDGDRDVHRHRDDDRDRHRVPAHLADDVSHLADQHPADEPDVRGPGLAVQPAPRRADVLQPHAGVGRDVGRELRRPALGRPHRHGHRHDLHRHRPDAQHPLHLLDPRHDHDASADLHHQVTISEVDLTPSRGFDPPR